LTWKGTNHRTVFNLLIFAARKKGSLRSLRYPEFSGFQFRSSRDSECKLLYSIGNLASSLHNKVCFFSTLGNSPMQSPNFLNLSPWALTKLHSHIFPDFFLQHNNNFSFSSTSPGRIACVLLLEIPHDHSHPQIQKTNQFSRLDLVHFPHLLNLQMLFVFGSHSPSYYHESENLHSSCHDGVHPGRLTLDKSYLFSQSISRRISNEKFQSANFACIGVGGQSPPLLLEINSCKFEIIQALNPFFPSNWTQKSILLC